MMYDVLNAEELIYISLASEFNRKYCLFPSYYLPPFVCLSLVPDKVISLVIAVSLPTVSTSIYFYQSKGVKEPLECQPNTVMEEMNLQGTSEAVQFSWPLAKDLLIAHIRSAISNKIVLLWSIWWILLNTGHNMVYAYNQPLWAFIIGPDRKDIYNGFAEAGLTFFGAIGALIAAKLNQKCAEKWAYLIVGLSCVILGIFSVVAGRTASVFVAYGMYVLLGAAYNFMITVTSAIVVKSLVQDSFALIFGINSWLSKLLVLLFTVVVVSGKVLLFNPREQYSIFGYYFFALAVAFGGYGMLTGAGKKTKAEGEVKRLTE